MQAEPRHEAMTWPPDYINNSDQQVKIKVQPPDKTSINLDPGEDIAVQVSASKRGAEMCSLM